MNSSYICNCGCQVVFTVQSNKRGCLIQLTPDSYIIEDRIVGDKWSNYIEGDENNKVEILDNMDELEVESSFYKNVAVEGLEDRIQGIKGDSYEVLFEMMKENKMFDFIYIDGSHLSFDCYSDLMISWRLLVRGGLLAIDDYLYNSEGAIIDSPFEGINHFLKKHSHEIKILHKGYRVFLQKV